MSGHGQGVPTATISLGGKSYKLAWTWGAKRRLNERLVAAGKELTAPNSIAENLPAVVWASMDEEAREKISVEQIEDLIHPGNEIEIIDKFSVLFSQSEPDPAPNAEPAAGKKQPTAGRSASKKSGQSASTTSG